jgi:hypothetical protein
MRFGEEERIKLDLRKTYSVRLKEGGFERVAEFFLEVCECDKVIEI